MPSHFKFIFTGNNTRGVESFSIGTSTYNPNSKGKKDILYLNLSGSGHWCIALAKVVNGTSRIAYSEIWMPFKHHQSRRHHIPKMKYRVTNWRDYDQGLVQRGDIRFWIDDEAIDARIAPYRTTPGGQREFSDFAVETTIAEVGQIAWQKDTDYGSRSKGEAAIGRVKSLINGRLTARTFGAQQSELAITLAIANKAIRAAKPVMVRVP